MASPPWRRVGVSSGGRYDDTPVAAINAKAMQVPELFPMGSRRRFAPQARVAVSRCHVTARRSTPGWTRTSDLRIRSPLLYPAELRAQIGHRPYFLVVLGD